MEISLNLQEVTFEVPTLPQAVSKQEGMDNLPSCSKSEDEMDQLAGQGNTQ